MDRRFFLAALAGPLLPALDPERLLWVPGKTKFFLPSIIRPEDRLLRALRNAAAHHGLFFPPSALHFTRRLDLHGHKIICVTARQRDIPGSVSKFNQQWGRVDMTPNDIFGIGIGNNANVPLRFDFGIRLS